MSTASDIDIFWGEIPACEHLLQIYEDDGVCLDALEGFAAAGLQAGDAVIVIATPAHREDLGDRLRAHGFDLAAARARDQYIPLDAEETLSKFMVKGWPDDTLFSRLVNELLVRAHGNGRRVRAFGEMVALLWSGGHNGATVRLEHLWQELCQAEGFSLFCAYPKIGFTQDMSTSIREICAAHSKLIAG